MGLFQKILQGEVPLEKPFDSNLLTEATANLQLRNNKIRNLIHAKLITSSSPPRLFNDMTFFIEFRAINKNRSCKNLSRKKYN